MSATDTTASASAGSRPSSRRQRIRQDSTAILGEMWGVLLAWWEHKIVSTLLLLGLLSAPGALWMLMSGIFFADRQLPQNAPIAERATHELGQKLIRPVATTVIVTAEAASRTGYQPAVAPRQAPVSSRLSASDAKALQRFAQQNGGVLVRFDR